MRRHSSTPIELILEILGGAGNSITFIQGNNHQNGNLNSTTCSVTLSSAIKSGSLVCVSVGWAGDFGITVTVSDDKGNNYNSVDVSHYSAAGYSWATFYLQNILNGPQTITATLSASNQFVTIMADEFSGVATSSSLEAHNINQQANTGTSTGNVTSNNITTLTNGDLIYSSAVDITSSGLVLGAGFSSGQAVVNTFYSEYKIQNSSGNTAGIFTALNGNNVDYIIGSVMAFKSL